MAIEPTTPTVHSTLPSSPPLYRVIFLHYFVNIELHFCCQFQWRTEGVVWGVQTPLPRNSEGPPKSFQTQPDLKTVINC